MSNWRNSLGELKDAISYVMAYAPDRFPVEDFLPPDGQMNLDRIFAQVRKLLEEVAKGKGESSDLAECRDGIEGSYQHYKAGSMDHGFLRIQEVLHILMKVGKRQ